jgi:DNA-binding MarR family transcriptional regulator
VERIPITDLLKRLAFARAALERLIHVEMGDDFPSDMNITQALMLARVCTVSGASAGDIRQIYSGTNCFYNVDKLVERGYVERKKDIKDRRIVRIIPTERGKQIGTLVSNKLKGIERGVGHLFSLDDYERIEQFCSQFGVNGTIIPHPVLGAVLAENSQIQAP